MGVEMDRRGCGDRQDFRHPLGKGVIAFLRLLPGIRLDSFLVSRECLQEKRRTEMAEGRGEMSRGEGCRQIEML